MSEEIPNGISRKSAQNWSEYFHSIKDNDITSFAFELAKKIAMDANFKSPVSQSESEFKISELTQEKNLDESSIIQKIVLDFYKQFDSDMYNIAESIINGNNSDFELIFYDSNNPQYENSPKAPCVTTIDEAKLKTTGTASNIICMPIEGYGTENQNIGLKNIFQLAHELSHAIATTYECERDSNESLDLNVKNGKRHFLFGETESEIVEMQLAKYLADTYPDFNSNIQNYIISSFIKSIELDARECYLKLGIGQLDYSEADSQELSDEELNEIGKKLNISNKDVLLKRIDKISKDGNITSRDPFKYMLGGLLAIQLAGKGSAEVSTTLKKFFECFKSADIKAAMSTFGLNGINVKSIDSLLNAYVNYANNFGKDATMKQDDEQEEGKRIIVENSSQKNNNSLDEGDKTSVHTILRSDVIRVAKKDDVVAEKENAKQAIKINLKENQIEPEIT